MPVTTVGQLLVNDALPEEFRDYMRTLDKGATDKVLGEIARKYPERYKEVSRRLMQLGADASFEEGATIRLSDLRCPIDKQPYLDKLRLGERLIAKSKLSDEEKAEQREQLYHEINEGLKEATYTAALASGNPFALQVKAKARGNKDQLAMLLTATGTYQDGKGRTVPMFIEHSHAEGLSPAEYWAATYGARRGVISCLVPETELRMADWSVKQLKDIQVGDMVLGSDVNGKTYPVRVSRVFDNGVQPVYEYVFTQGVPDKDLKIRATREHKMLAAMWDLVSTSASALTDYTLRPLKDAHAVSGYCVKEAASHARWVCYEHLYIGDLPVMDIEVDHPDHMFVLANGLVSSNSKFATRNAGYLGKLMGMATMATVVSEEDCGTPYGLPVSTSDPDSVGGILAKPAGGFPAGTPVTKDVLQKLQAAKIDEFVVRSPITCGTKNGVCKYCSGLRETGKLPPIGYHLGQNATQPLANVLAQSSLNVKHCLSPDTPVRLVSGDIVPLCAVRVGDMVVGVDTRGVRSPATVLDVIDTGKQDCWQTTFAVERAGKPTLRFKLVSTLAHKVLVSDGRIEPLEHVKRSECVSVIIDDQVCKARITSQVWLGDQPTMDLSIDHPDHLFLLGTGAVVSNSGKKSKGQTSYSGFDVIKSMATVPETFQYAATVAEQDGRIEKIDDAPQGGKYVYINGQQHYIPTELPMEVKVGDTVEAGDQLCAGVGNPADIVRLKGLGEGRRYFASRFTKAFRESNLEANRRNVEVLARDMIDHVTIDDNDAEGENLPGDTVTYSSWSYGYKPRKNAVVGPAGKAVGAYLEQPALHYTIGTRITPSVVRTLEKHGAGQVMTHKDPVGVTPHMVSIIDTPTYQEDWQSRLGTSYLQKRFETDVQRGAESNRHTTHPIPGIARGTEFGRPVAPGKPFTY